MAKSERRDRAAERVARAVVNKEDRVNAITNLTQVISDEITNSFSPFNPLEIPSIIVALRAIERSMKQQFQTEAALAAQLEENFSVIRVTVPFGRKEK